MTSKKETTQQHRNRREHGHGTMQHSYNTRNRGYGYMLVDGFADCVVEPQHRDVVGDQYRGAEEQQQQYRGALEEQQQQHRGALEEQQQQYRGALEEQQQQQQEQQQQQQHLQEHIWAEPGHGGAHLIGAHGLAMQSSGAVPAANYHAVLPPFGLVQSAVDGGATVPMFAPMQGPYPYLPHLQPLAPPFHAMNASQPMHHDAAQQLGVAGDGVALPYQQPYIVPPER